jgi:SAM-dependent methyltransferase
LDIIEGLGKMKNEPILERETSLTGILCQAIFHLVCCRPAPECSAEDKEKYFRWRLSEAVKFINRFAGMVDVCGKSILDFGCGYGSMSFVLAQNGARRVVGVDIDGDRVAFARNKLNSEFSNLSRTIEFALPDELGQERFDLVISEDSFEHYRDPVGVMKSLRDFLGDAGQVVIGFSPLWKSPYGGHIRYMTKVPWAHLLFSERIIMRERKRYRPNENARVFSEMRGGLNKMTYAKFLETIRDSGYKFDYLATNVSESKMAFFVNFVRRLPFCFEYFTKNLYAIVSLESDLRA